MAGAIEVEGLVKRYRRADRNAVDGVSFTVEAGEFFALLGPNGAGKTTTISILTTTMLPTSGEVRVAGHDVVIEPGAVRRRVGIIFQRPSLDQNLTGEENVRLHCLLYGIFPYRPWFRAMPAEYRRRVSELAALLGIDQDMFKPIKRLSGGTQRKLEIVRSLMHRPQVLFLDEPTAGLDTAARHSLWRYIESLRQTGGTTILLTTHYLQEAEGSDRVCILNRGRVAALGSPAELKSRFVPDQVVIDAEDRAGLAAELAAAGVSWSGIGPFLVTPEPGPASVHRLLRRIQTPLTTLKVTTPTLEEAYLRMVAATELELEESSLAP